VKAPTVPPPALAVARTYLATQVHDRRVPAMLGMAPADLVCEFVAYVEARMHGPAPHADALDVATLLREARATFDKCAPPRLNANRSATSPHDLIYDLAIWVELHA
jgi:hypothetical protein